MDKTIRWMLKKLPKGLPPGYSALENINKVTFTTRSGKSFTMDGARVWKINQFGNIIYTVHGGFKEDLEELLKEEVPVEGEQK